MALTTTFKFDQEKVFSGLSLAKSTVKIAAGTIAFDNSYAGSGGEAFSIPGMTIDLMVFGNTAGYGFDYVPSTEKIIVYAVHSGDGNAFNEAALTEAAATTDLHTTCAAVPFIAIGH